MIADNANSMKLNPLAVENNLRRVAVKCERRELVPQTFSVEDGISWSKCSTFEGFSRLLLLLKSKLSLNIDVIALECNIKGILEWLTFQSV